MMKRLLCLVLCLMFAIPVALADTADTLPKKFNRQLVGGNGLRGYMNITASGVAEWLDALLPFTATQIQIRAAGQKQGEMSEFVTDDDDWQVRFYAKNSEGKEVGNTWLYGDPEGVYFQSELLPDTLLAIPVEQVHLLYQLMQGDYAELLFAFDPLEMKAPGAQGNAPAYEAVANLLGIDGEEWTTTWLPVLEKYFLQLDLWLMGYSEPAAVTGEDGSLHMAVTYQIPADELKAEAKYIIGQMLYDTELQNLLLPYVTMEQRMTYLNPGLVYFYEACIDSLPLQGDIVLSRTMSAQGEIVSAQVALPIPALPEKLTEPVGDLAAALFGADYADVLTGIERVEFAQNGAKRVISFTGANKTITVAADASNPDESTAAYDGKLTIQPVEGQALTADFKLSTSHRIWVDEKYLDHDTSTISFEIEPAAESADFDPVSFAFTVDYRNNPHQANSAVQINYNLDASLPGASVQVEAVLRITPQVTMQNLSTEGAENALTMMEERKAALLSTFVINADTAMAALNGTPVNAPAAEPTAVPPMTE